MRQSPQGWRAVDVLLDGTISRVAVQRSDFRSLLNHGGAPALAKSLQEKTADLSGGAG
jgi:phospholipid transport system substrate-binding protein